MLLKFFENSFSKSVMLNISLFGNKGLRLNTLFKIIHISKILLVYGYSQSPCSVHVSFPVFPFFFSKCIFFFWSALHGMSNLNSFDQRLNLCPLQWKPGVLTNEPPGESLCSFVRAKWASQFHLVKPKFRDSKGRDEERVI